MRGLLERPRPLSSDEWRAEAFQELLAKQDRLEAELHLGKWPRYDYDLERRSLIFSDTGGPRVIADIQAIGTTSERDWLWAWANPSLPKSSTEDALRVKAFGAEHEIADLTRESVESASPDELGWELTAAAVRVVDAAGAYRAPSKSVGSLFLLIRSIRFVN
jgi:hypothetical protein